MTQPTGPKASPAFNVHVPILGQTVRHACPRCPLNKPEHDCPVCAGHGYLNDAQAELLENRSRFRV